MTVEWLYSLLRGKTMSRNRVLCEGKKKRKWFFFTLKHEQSRMRGRESERCEGAHCPHVAEQLPAELTSPRLNDNTSRWPSNSDLWPLVVHQVLRNVQASDRCASLSSACLQSIAAKVKQHLGKERATRHTQKKTLNAGAYLTLCLSFSLFFFCPSGKHLPWMCQRQVSFVRARSGGHYESVSDSSNGELGLYLNPEERNSQDSCVDMCASSFFTEKL